ncbi:MAG: exopolysaccharide biosynthesis polyprenyl glycosylphosphotransferase [Ruminococcaceae bacterium]|nr:exopolysaccharide biosynthesis polyprenyl glycosylphosphotransferase [Oscillospiraceae bacterium]
MKQERFKRLLIFTMSSILIVLLLLLYWIIWSHFYADTIKLAFWTKGHWMMLAVYLLLLCIFTKVYGGQHIGSRRILDIVYSHSLAALFANIVDYPVICLLAYKISNPLPMLLLTAMDVLVITLWSVAAKRIYRKLYPPRKLLVVTNGSASRFMIKRFSERNDSYKASKFIEYSQGLDAIKSECQKYDGMALCDIPATERNELMQYCFENNILMYVEPSLSDLIMTGATDSTTSDTPMYLLRNCGLTAEKRFFKRMLDLVIIVPLALIMLPFMAIIALLIKFYDGGSVFYKQERLTEGGKIFMIYKFRSMRMDSEGGKARLARKNDDRITPVGRVLRAIHFDELPQIINILKGDMSIVGPRPERPEIAEQYKDFAPAFDYRLKVKAGLTGYAQVFGKYNTPPQDKLKLDLYYIQHQNVLLDIELILKTIKILFVKDNTEGVEDWQLIAGSEEDAPQSSD